MCFGALWSPLSKIPRLLSVSGLLLDVIHRRAPSHQVRETAMEGTLTVELRKPYHWPNNHDVWGRLLEDSPTASGRIENPSNCQLQDSLEARLVNSPPRNDPFAGCRVKTVGHLLINGVPVKSGHQTPSTHAVPP